MPRSARDRHWPGFSNARSLEGVATASGPIAPGRLYRADEPRGPLGPVRAALEAEGISTVLDLRSAAETSTRPSIDSGLASYVVAPLVDPRMDHLRDPESERSLLDLYRGSIARNGRTIAAATRAVIQAPPGGVLVHCMVGKDRTGILLAVILDALGAPAEQIIEDYTRTEANLAPHFAAELAAVQDPARRQRLAFRQHSTPETMAGLLEELHTEHGGGAAYLARHGLSKGQLEALSRRLCSPSEPAGSS